MKRSIENFNAISRLFQEQANAGKFSQDLNNAISNNAVTAVTHTLYVKKDISAAGGIFRILDENVKKLDGVSNISENKLPKNQALIFDKIGISFGKGNADKMGDATFDLAFPAALQNAILSIRQLGNVIVERPVSDFYAKGTAQDPKEKVLEIGIPNVLRDDEPIDMEFIFPKGSSMPAAADADNALLAEVKLFGATTRRKAQ